MLKSLQPNSALVSDAKVPPIALSRLDSIAVGLIFAALAAFAAFALSDKPSVRAWRTHCLYAIGAGVVLLWGLRFFAIGV